MLNDLLCLFRRMIGMKYYQRVTLRIDGGKGGFIDTQPNVIAFMVDCECPDDYIVVDHWMWPSKFKELKEFNGF